MITKQIKMDSIRPFYNETGIYDVGDIQRKSIGKFFDKDTMRFFKSKVIDDVFPSRGVVYFVTSEKKCFNDDTRVFTVRSFDIASRSVSTVGELGSYSTKTQALTGALNCAYDMLNSEDR